MKKDVTDSCARVLSPEQGETSGRRNPSVRKTNVCQEQTRQRLYCQILGRTIYELVVAELAEDLTGEMRMALHDHILRCSICLGVYTGLKRIDRVIRANPGLLAAAVRDAGVHFDKQSSPQIGDILFERLKC